MTTTTTTAPTVIIADRIIASMRARGVVTSRSTIRIGREIEAQDIAAGIIGAYVAPGTLGWLAVAARGEHVSAYIRRAIDTASVRCAWAGGLAIADAARTAAAIDAIGAIKYRDGYAYRAEETGEWYVLSDDDIELLVELLADGRPDAYSRWYGQAGELATRRQAARLAAKLAAMYGTTTTPEEKRP